MPRNETIVLSPGENRLDRIGAGEVVENVLVDQRARGASYHIRASGDGWIIRNVGFLGTAQVADIPWGGFHMALSGNGLVENLYLDNRDAETSIGAALASRGHSGDIEVRNTYIAGQGNNAFYGSNPGKTSSGATGGDGTVRFYNCYHRDNTPSNFRIGTPGSLIENCVSVIDDPTGRRGPYPNSSSKRARGIWVRHAPDQHIRDSVVYVADDDVHPRAALMIDCIGKSHGPRAEVFFDNVSANPASPSHSGWAGLIYDPQRDCPAVVNGSFDTASWTAGVLRDGGVPTSAEMASNGGREMPPELPGGTGIDGGNGNGENGENGNGNGENGDNETDDDEARLGPRLVAYAVIGGLAYEVYRRNRDK